MIIATKNCEASIQQHAFFVQQKARILFAFVVTMFLLCIENVKAFTAPLCNPDTLLFMASGAHSIAKRRWASKPGTLSIRQTSQHQASNECNSVSNEQPTQVTRPHLILNRSQRKSNTSLNMAFSFASLTAVQAQPTLDMKTSINAFGSWYNQMDPVARPPDYDE